LGRVQLAHLPTPLHPLPRLSRKLGGPQLWIKRDDLTGLAGGGNKTRKLEFLIAEALNRGCDTVLTAGGAQSNHCRQTAAACAQVGLACHLVLGGEPPVLSLGNLLLDQLLGATVHWVEKTRRNSRLEELADELRARTRKPYVIPIGGSNPLGCIGYACAMAELLEQAKSLGLTIDRIVFATSSGGTQAGLVLGGRLCGFRGRITAISIDQPPDDAEHIFLADVAQIATDAAERIGRNVQFSADDCETEYGYLGGGYGVVNPLERDAIHELAHLEGILTGPVYTGRAFGALLDMIGRGAIAADETVVFWHTGDDVALHAYSPQLAPRGAVSS
jgi:D-cysteine desulfhydrase